MTMDVHPSTPGNAAPGQLLWQTTGTAPVNAGATPTLTFTGDGGTLAGTLTAAHTLFVTDIYVSGNTTTPFTVTISYNGTAIFNGEAAGNGPIQLSRLGVQPFTAGDGTHGLAIVFGTAASTTAAWYVAGYIL